MYVFEDKDALDRYADKSVLDPEEEINWEVQWQNLLAYAAKKNKEDREILNMLCAFKREDT